jgi:hypothetical protein
MASSSQSSGISSSPQWFVLTFSTNKHDPDAKTRTLRWRLLTQHAVTRKWIELMQSVQQAPFRVAYESFSLLPDGADPTLLITQLQTSCAFVREHAKALLAGVIDPVDPTPVLSSVTHSLRSKMDCLNRVHAEFEVGYNYVLQQRAKGLFVPTAESLEDQMDRHLNAINNAVHGLQAALNPGNQAQSASILSNTRATPVVDLADEDYAHFTLERSFGDLLLSYGVTGKSLHHISTDQDIGLLQEHGTSAITSQRIITSAWFAWFGRIVGPEEYDVYVRWCLANRVQETWNIDPLDPKLGLGYIPLGHLDRSLSEGLSDKTDSEILHDMSAFTDCITVRFE